MYGTHTAATALTTTVRTNEGLRDGLFTREIRQPTPRFVKTVADSPSTTANVSVVQPGRTQTARWVHNGRDRQRRADTA